jgi:exodeoxyribonuclease V alpha subunit
MRVTLDTVLFPKKGQELPANGFTILRLICNEHKKDCELAIDYDGSDLYGETFIAKGYFLPTAKSLEYEFFGTWKTDDYGRSLIVESFEENIPENKTGIMAYLTSGLIKGISTMKAQKIYDKFGDATLKILDENPERLMEVPGIKQKNLEKIISSYTAYRGAKDVVSMLAPLGISSNKAVKIYNKFKQESVNIVKNEPFKLCDINGISFKVADMIASKQNLNPNAEDRLRAGLIEVLKQAESGGPLYNMGSGHLCIPYSEWLEKASELLSSYTNSVNYNELKEISVQLSKEKKVEGQKNPENGIVYVYRTYTAEAEKDTANALIDLISASKEPKYDILDNIRQMELKNNFRLAPEQSNAVVTGLKNYLSIITGGPGTGKTTIINFIREIYAANNPSAKILLCAPTGRASRRMSESTGYPACTIHKALNIKANDDNDYGEVEPLDYDLIIVDEISMLDIFLARTFFKAIKKGCQVVLIGDADQLPSVGPGAVLSEMINSEVIKVAKLTRVYRQAGDSKIALNSLLMKRGNYQFDYDETFQFIAASNFEEAAKKMEEIFISEVGSEGIDNVTMLSPFRSNKTATGVDALNAEIRDKINPPSNDKMEVSAFGKLFREGDKVMQTKNVEDISNGDIGYITKITGSSEKTITIDFGDDRIVDYETADLETIQWAYATTVHKSQGSEYRVVIFNILPGHGVMLKRNLVYTAVTRARQKVYIIGSKDALFRSVLTGTDDKDKRNTMLALRLRNLYQKLQASQASA